MISSIFGKTKPINFIIVSIFLFLLYGLVQFYPSWRPFNSLEVTLRILALVVLVLSVFIVDFIIKKNKLTGTNSFAILFFGLLCMLFPETLLDPKALFCSFFLLLATRRILSIKSLKNSKLKIFDATLWVLVSSIFYTWALLFLFLIFTAIYIYDSKNIRNWLVPIVSIFVFSMISISVLLVLGKNAFPLNQYAFSVDFNEPHFLNKVTDPRFLIYLIGVVFLAIWTFIKSGNTGVGKTISIRLMGISFLLGLLVYILSVGQGNTIVITFFPAVIFFTNHIESVPKKNIKEALLMLSVFIVFLVFATTLMLS